MTVGRRCPQRERPEPDLPLDPCPTAALPGSPEKVEVLLRRFVLGYSLFHPLDAPLSEDNARPPFPGEVGGATISREEDFS